MKIILTPQLEELIRQKVASGHYASVSEVVIEALRLMEVRDQLLEEEFTQLRQEIEQGVGSGLATAWDADEVKQAGRAKRKAKTGSAGK